MSSGSKPGNAAAKSTPPPATPPTGHWASLGESTFTAGIWLLYALHKLLGRSAMRIVLYPVALGYWMASSTARHASLDYLRRMQAAHGNISPRSGVAPGAAHSVRHFHSFAETILDKILAISGRYRLDTVRYEGREAVDAMIARGQGAIVVTAHVGCLELCQAAASRQPGLKLTVLVHTRHAERFNAILKRLAPDSPVRLMQVTDVDAATAVMLAARVEAGEFIAIAGDRVPVTASKTAQAMFLGSPAPFPVGAYVLASLIKCPLLLLACLREPAGHVVHFQQLAENMALPRAQRAHLLAVHAQDFASRLEALLVRAPYDWFNFFNFWEQPHEA